MFKDLMGVTKNWSKKVWFKVFVIIVCDYTYTELLMILDIHLTRLVCVFREKQSYICAAVRVLSYQTYIFVGLNPLISVLCLSSIFVFLIGYAIWQVSRFEISCLFIDPVFFCFFTIGLTNAAFPHLTFHMLLSPWNISTLLFWNLCPGPKLTSEVMRGCHAPCGLMLWRLSGNLSVY